MRQTKKYSFIFRCVTHLCMLFFMQQATAQNSYIYADKTILAGRGIGNNEFEVHNGTRGVLGALVNVGGGVTQFIKVVESATKISAATTRYHYTDGSDVDITIDGTGAITVESDPVATAKTITITGSSDVPVTGGTQTIGANPSFTLGSVNWANGFSVYDARYLTASTQNEVISGGKVTWLHDYVYNVSAATYLIDGVNYSSPSTDITLSTADATDDRIDVFALTTSNTAIAITGTPSTPAVEPSIDANTQLQISFADINAGSTTPTLNIDWIYQENAEWTTATSSPGTVNLSSTNSPYAGSKDIEGTSVANNTTISFTRATAPTMGNYQSLVFEIKSKANWSTTKKWVLRFFNGTTAIGNPVNFGSSSYGFVSTSTSQYQTITIPLSDFGSISTATKLVITQSNSSGTIGWFLDNMQLQGGGGGGTPSTVALVKDVNGTGTNTISTTVVGIRGVSVPTLAAGNLKFNGSIWVFDNATYLTGNQSITISGDATGTGTTSIPLTLATVNSSPGTYGSASQSLTGTVNGKGLLTSLSAQSIQIAESQVTNLTTDLSGKQGTLTLTTTGTTGASTLVGSTLNIPQYSAGGGSGWPLSGTGTLTGVATIVSNTANQHLFNGTWTTTANNQFHWQFNPTITTRNAANDTINGILINPTITPGNNAQWLAAVNINPTFSGINSSSNDLPIGLKVSSGMIAIDSISATDKTAALSVALNNASSTTAAWNSKVIIRSKRIPSSFFQVYDNSNEASGGNAAVVMQLVNSTGTSLLKANGRSFDITYGSGSFSFNDNGLYVGANNAFIAATYEGYTSTYNFCKGLTSPTVPTINLSSNAHLLVGTQTDNSYRMYVNGDANIKSDLVVSPLTTPSGTAAVFGTAGTTTITYKIVGRTVTGRTTDASAAITVTTANATLSATNFVRITVSSDVVFSAIINRTQPTAFYDIYRVSTGGTSPTSTGKIGTINMSNTAPGSGALFDDTGLSGDGTTGATVNSTGNVTAQFYRFASYTSAQISALTGMVAGDTIYCSDCTANDASTGVMETYNGSTFKKNW